MAAAASRLFSAAAMAAFAFSASAADTALAAGAVAAGAAGAAALEVEAGVLAQPLAMKVAAASRGSKYCFIIYRLLCFGGKLSLYPILRVMKPGFYSNIADIPSGGLPVMANGL